MTTAPVQAPPQGGQPQPTPPPPINVGAVMRAWVIPWIEERATANPDDLDISISDFKRAARTQFRNDQPFLRAILRTAIEDLAIRTLNAVLAELRGPRKIIVPTANGHRIMDAREFVRQARAVDPNAPAVSEERCPFWYEHTIDGRRVRLLDMTHVQLGQVLNNRARQLRPQLLNFEYERRLYSLIPHDGVTKVGDHFTAADMDRLYNQAHNAAANTVSVP